MLRDFFWIAQPPRLKEEGKIRATPPFGQHPLYARVQLQTKIL
jgi:hypothetical protein